MYDQTSLNNLKDKLDYELWLLGFLYDVFPGVSGNPNISDITLTQGKRGAQISLSASDTIGGGAVEKIIGKIMPLTFTAAYKILDMIVEWILDENWSAGNISHRRRWTFIEKGNVITWPQIVYPPIFQTETYLKDYLIALYKNLEQARHEIVHRHDFSMTGGNLVIKTGTGSNYNINKNELGSFVKVAVTGAKLLIGESSFDLMTDRWLRYHLDVIHSLHNQKLFQQKEPLHVKITLRVPICGNKYLVDLDYARGEVSRIHPQRDVLFSFEIVGLVNGEPSVAWNIPASAIPQKSILELPADEFESYRVG